MSSFGVTCEQLISVALTEKEEQKKAVKELGGIEKLAAALRTDLEKGISTEEEPYEDRLRTFGNNVLPNSPTHSFFALWFEQLKEPILIILIIAAVISLIFGVALPHEGEEGTAWIEGAAILIAVALVSLVSAANNYAQELSFRALDKKKEDKTVTVIRDGKRWPIPSAAVMVGDIVILAAGDKIPADGIYIKTDGAPECHVDNSTMTGETLALHVDKTHPILLSGALIVTGDVIFIAIATGIHSQWGILFSRLMRPTEPTPLQLKLRTLAKYIGYFGACAALVIFFVLLIFWLVSEISGTTTVTSCFKFPPNVVTCHEFDKDNRFEWDNLADVVGFFIIAITVVVVAVPEGLPLAVTLSLAFSMRKMQHDNCLVRRLESCETMGGATQICSDKTGTLTENNMTVVAGYLFEQDFDQVPIPFEINDRMHKILYDGLAVNADATINKVEKGDDEEGTPKKKAKRPLWKRCLSQVPFIGGKFKESTIKPPPELTGSKTEIALLVFCGKMDVDYNAIRAHMKDNDLLMKKLGFTSARKRMSVIVRLEEGQDEEAEGPFRMYTKGASEIILKRSVRYVDKNFKVKEMTEKKRERFAKMISKRASDGLRTIGVAYRDFQEESDFDIAPPMEAEPGAAPVEEEDIEVGLTFLGFTGIEDPLRKEVPEAVRICQEAGIRVRMVTGDNIETASKIARDANILTDGIAMEGSEFREKSDKELDEILPKLQVLARSVPLDKERLVTRLRALGEIVSVTGDGTNDAPALKAANVGLAMGSGTDIAKQASDIVILDDNFNSIVLAVMWGRCVYDNICKFLQFQLTVNFGACTVALVGAITGRGTPLTAVQLLWVNLIMDTLAALALATEKPTRDLLSRKPYGTNEIVPINALMTRNIVGQGLWQIAILLTLLYGGSEILDVEDQSRDHYTIIFNTFVWLQLFNEINSRKVHGEWNVFKNIYVNYYFLVILVVVVVLQVILVEFGSDGLKVQGQTWWEWVLAIALGASGIPFGFLLRLIPIECLWRLTQRSPCYRFIAWAIKRVVKLCSGGDGDDDDDKGNKPEEKKGLLDKEKKAAKKGSEKMVTEAEEVDEKDSSSGEEDGSEDGVEMKELKKGKEKKEESSDEDISEDKSEEEKDAKEKEEKKDESSSDESDGEKKSEEKWESEKGTEDKSEEKGTKEEGDESSSDESSD